MTHFQTRILEAQIMSDLPKVIHLGNSKKQGVTHTAAAWLHCLEFQPLCYADMEDT